MTTNEWLIIAILILFIILYKMLQALFHSDPARTKGYLGEKFVIDLLNEWVTVENLQGKARFYKSLPFETQKIDVVFKNTFTHNIGIEVKYRTADNLRYLPMEHISRFHVDGNRQSSKQLYQYIKPKNMLGLYAFVFVKEDGAYLHFLPHYIIEGMIRQNKTSVRVEEIILHPNGYTWGDNNKTFFDYIRLEYQNQ